MSGGCRVREKRLTAEDAEKFRRDRGEKLLSARTREVRKGRKENLITEPQRHREDRAIGSSGDRVSEAGVVTTERGCEKRSTGEVIENNIR